MRSHYRVIYDEQCEVCQAGVSWLKILDHNKRVAVHPIDPGILHTIHPTLKVEECLRELHVVSPGGEVAVGADAVILLARLFPETRLIGTIAGVPGVRVISRMLYRFVALNRYALSKCRGGACHVVRPDELVKRSGLGAFWSCYVIGMIIRMPLSITAAIRDAIERIKRYVFTYRKRMDLLDGRLRLLFLGGMPCDVVPLILGEQLRTTGGCLEVYPAPGHSNDHVVLYDRREKLMIVADAFMGVYFSAPNPDVDSRNWIQTLERLLALDIEILIEGHGFIHTMRPDIPDIPGVVIRRNPKEELQEKLQYLKWLREQIEAGLSEGF